jgi:uncharacterized SAM-binding protein YcdF (DUF218 family)
MRPSTAKLRLYRPKGRSLRHFAILVTILLALSAYGVSTPFGALLLIDSLQTFPALTAEQTDALKGSNSSAIVILAAGRRSFAPEFGGETVDEISLERLRYGAKLARVTGLPVLVSGGLGGEGAAPLADLLAAVLEQDYGVGVRWREARSANTHENALYSATSLKQAGIKHVVLVTHAWHMRRSVAAFAAQDMDLTPAPTAFYRRRVGPADFVPAAGAIRMSYFAFHEIGGRLWYWLRYGY